MINDYKQLRVWRQGMEIVVMIYHQMPKMPGEELFNLTAQIKRAAVSVPSNIAEGQPRSAKEFLHFLRIAQGSLAELETQLLITIELRMLQESDIHPILNQIISLKKQIYSLMNRLKDKIGNG